MCETKQDKIALNDTISIFILYSHQEILLRDSVSPFEGQVGYDFFFRSSDIRQSGIGVDKINFWRALHML